MTENLLHQLGPKIRLLFIIYTSFTNFERRKVHLHAQTHTQRYDRGVSLQTASQSRNLKNSSRTIYISINFVRENQSSTSSL